MLGYTMGQVTFPLICFGLGLWVGLVIFIRVPLRHRTPMDPYLRNTFIVTFIGVLIGLAVTSGLSLFIGTASDATQMASIATRTVVVVGGLYGYVNLILFRRRRP